MIGLIKKYGILGTVALLSMGSAFAQTPIPIGPQTNTFTSMVRGYHFTSPVGFKICGLYIPTDASMGLQSVEVVRFTAGAPPAFPGTTNAFTSLFYQANWPTNTMIPCNVQVNTGDVMGVYGARAANMVNSYDGVNYVTTISGQNATLSRSGMQANLSTGQMANIWSEVFYNIGRIIMYYECCPDPPTPQLATAPTQICSNDTFTYAVSPYAFATGYSWNFGSSGTIINANIDSSEVEVVFNGNTVFDTVCVTMYDTCSSSDTCFAVTINPPTAFAGNDTSICSTTMQLNGNAGNGYWTVLGGSGTFANSNDYNTTVTGLAPGVNTLSWTIANSNCPAVFDEINIEVKPVPVAQMIFQNGCDQDGIQFTDDSYALNGTILDWDWDVDGNGTFDYSTTSFSHVYPGPGTYQCTLIATANQGCQDTLIQPVIVYPNPQVNFTHSPDCEGSATAFTDLTTIASGNISDWHWDFGDGTNPSNAQSPAHVYAEDGFYPVTLTVTSNLGCVKSYIDTIEVFSIPIVDFYSPEMCSNDSVYFSDTSISVQGTINYWEWDFGDGSPTDNNQYTVHKYPTHGLYSVRLTVATDSGCTNTVVKDQRSFPVPVPNYTQEGQCERQRVTFTDNSQLDTIFGSVLVDWHWDFGDGDDAWNETVGHFYDEPGYYMLNYTPYTNHGCHHTQESEILLRPKPEAKIVILDDKVCAGNEVHYRNETFFDYEFDSVGVVSYNWKFGDGNTSIKEHPVNTFKVGGTYQTALRVETQYGCIDSVFKNTIIYHNPVAEYVIDTIENCSPHCPTLIDKSHVASNDSLSYVWTFGDGNTNDEDVNPTYCYTVENGTGVHTFSTSLEVKTAYGCSDKFAHENDIVVHANPIADFELSASEISFLEPVVYIDDFSVDADYWNWSFGDSTFSNESSPIMHKYESPGVYNVQLIVSTAFGCDNIASKNLVVKRHQTFFIPNSFTPDGDNVNDYFEVYGEDIQEVKLWVYDRWGQQLFYGENAKARWDGKVDGKYLPIGIYSYVVQYKLTNQPFEKVTGSFTISNSANKTTELR